MVASSKLMQLVLLSFGKASTPLSTGFVEAWLTMLAMGIKHGSDLMFGLNRFLLVFFSCTSSADESAEWRDLGLLFTTFELLEADDVGYWLLTRDQNYSAKSLYSSCLIQG
jgi:hypothetical protein